MTVFAGGKFDLLSEGCMKFLQSRFLSILNSDHMPNIHESPDYSSSHTVIMHIGIFFYLFRICSCSVVTSSVRVALSVSNGKQES